MMPHEKARLENSVLIGAIPYLDFQFGNVWTNLDETVFAKLAPAFGDRFRVTILRGGRTVFTGELPYVRTFGEVAKGAPLIYMNSLLNVAVALNQGNFSKAHGIGSGADWSMWIEKMKP
jgi:S-adenosylmethionine hydrolase